MRAMRTCEAFDHARTRPARAVARALPIAATDQGLKWPVRVRALFIIGAALAMWISIFWIAESVI